MAKTYESPFTQKKATGQAVCTSANTSLVPATNNANLQTLYTGTSDQSVIKRVSAVPLQTITATQLQLFRQKASGLIILWRTLLMPAYTFAATNQAPEQSFPIAFDEPWALENNEKILAGIAVAAATGIAFTLEAEEY